VNTQRCVGLNSTMNGNSTAAIVPKHNLRYHYTLASEGWQLWHYVMATVSIAVGTRVFAYLVLRFGRKPTAA